MIRQRSCHRRLRALHLSLFLGLLALGTIGCSSARTQSYQLVVKNDTPRPLTLWLTKEGPPVEDSWLSPEQLAMRQPSREAATDVVIQPGKIADTKEPVEGKFAPGSQAVLRVYAGTPRLSEILATNRNSPDRLDIPVEPGKTSLTITQENGRLAANRVPVSSEENSGR